MGRVAVEQLQAAIEPNTRILLDSSIIIAYLNPDDAFAPHALRIIGDFVFSGRNTGLVSTIAVMEALVRPMRAGPPEGYLRVLDFFQRFPHLSYLAVDLPVAQEAASLRAHFGLGVADALTIAAALVGQTSYIVSADRAWVSKLKAIQTRVELICLA